MFFSIGKFDAGNDFGDQFGAICLCLLEVPARIASLQLVSFMLIRLFQQTTSCSVRGVSPNVSENFARISVAVLH